MQELTSLMEKRYTILGLMKLRKRIIEYITPYNVEDIRWEAMDGDMLQAFYDENYYDVNENEYVYWIDLDDKMPIGMHYLSFERIHPKIKYFIGSIPNNVSKRTIIGCICYSDIALIDGMIENVTSVETVEINYFYRNQGLLSKMMEAFPKGVNFNQNIIVTPETTMGKKSKVMEHMKKNLILSGFPKDIRFEYEVDYEYVKKLQKK